MSTLTTPFNWFPASFQIFKYKQKREQSKSYIFWLSSVVNHTNNFHNPARNASSMGFRYTKLVRSFYQSHISNTRYGRIIFEMEISFDFRSIQLILFFLSRFVSSHLSWSVSFVCAAYMLHSFVHIIDELFNTITIFRGFSTVEISNRKLSQRKLWFNYNSSL